MDLHQAEQYLKDNPKPKFGDDIAIRAMAALRDNRRVTCWDCSGNAALPGGPLCAQCRNTGYVWVPKSSDRYRL